VGAQLSGIVEKLNLAGLAARPIRSIHDSAAASAGAGLQNVAD
jgi:hypothetical protein